MEISHLRSPRFSTLFHTFYYFPGLLNQAAHYQLSEFSQFQSQNSINFYFLHIIYISQANSYVVIEVRCLLFFKNFSCVNDMETVMRRALKKTLKIFKENTSLTGSPPFGISTQLLFAETWNLEQVCK